MTHNAPKIPRTPTQWTIALVVSLLLWSSSAAAESFLERVGRLVGEAERTAAEVARVIGGEEQEPGQDEDRPAPTVPEGLPEHWQLGIVHEPVFDSRILVAETGLAHSQTVILIHGLGENGLRDWLRVIPALEEHYHVLAFDLPGFGHSEKPGGRYSPQRYAELVHWLVEQSGQDRVHLVGHSMGGAIALRYAANHPEQVDRLALASVAGVLQRTAFMKHTAELPLDESRANSQAVKRATSQVKSWGDRLVEVASTTLPDPTVILKYSNTAWKALLSDRPNINAALSLIEENYSSAIAGLNTPTLILWGTEDRVAPPRTGKMLAGRLRHADLHLIEQAGHPIIRSHFETFNERLLSFLSSDEPLAFSPIPDPDSDRRGDLRCRGESGRHYSGHFRRIVIENCSSVTLSSVRAQSLTIKNSRVFIEHIAVEGEDTALQVQGSSVEVTHGHFAGARGISAENSTLDLAGVTVRGQKRAVSAGEGSRFVFSVSDVQGPDFSESVHGVYQLENETLGESSSKD